MDKVKIAVVGAGVIGKRHLLASLGVEEVSIVGIVDPSFASSDNVDPYIAEFAASSNGASNKNVNLNLCATYDELLALVKPDGVVVATPTEHHLQPTLQALNSAAHVLVEKPIMANLSECEKTIALAEKTNKHVLVAHQRRYYSLVEQARSIVQGGQLGQLVSVNGQWTMRKPLDYYAADWRKNWQAGPILTNLIHDMDMLRYIAGDVESLTAETSNNVLNYEKEDAAAILLRFKNGALGTFMLSDQSHSPWSWEHGFGENAAFPASGENSIRFMGTKGSLEFPNLRVWNSTTGDGCWTNTISSEDIHSQHEDAYIEQLTHFADVIQGRAHPRVSAADATETLRATLAVYESASSGSRVSLLS